MSFPKILPIRQLIRQPTVADIPRTVREQIAASRIRDRVKPGGRIAVGVGSRGIRAIQPIVRAVVETLTSMEYRPFVVAAMGSHGDACSDGQREILHGYGITEEALGVEVRTEMEAVVLGESPIGLPIYFDKNAYESDGIVLVNRVKPHTDFRGDHESGILKMLVIGLGKQQGAAQVHRLGLRGFHELLPAVGKILLEKTPFALGVAIVENARDEPSEIVAIEPEEIFEVEPGLLAKARERMGRLPFDQIDVLIVGELGKNYSGAGMDPNVIGRLYVETLPNFDRPVVTRLCVLDVSEESHGNIVGVGFADLTTDRLVAKLDPGPFRTNVLTSCSLERARIPITLPDDREVFRVALETCWRVDPSQSRMVLIPNTLELEQLWVSDAMAGEVEGRADLQIAGEAREVPFDESGDLDQASLFPDCVRSLRSGRSAR